MVEKGDKIIFQPLTKKYFERMSGFWIQGEIDQGYSGRREKRLEDKKWSRNGRCLRPTRSIWKKESGALKVKELLIKPRKEFNLTLMTTVNWGEVFMFWSGLTHILEAERIQQVVETFPMGIYSGRFGAGQTGGIIQGSRSFLTRIVS